jgi:hypothetical protein
LSSSGPISKPACSLGAEKLERGPISRVETVNEPAELILEPVGQCVVAFPGPAGGGCAGRRQFQLRIGGIEVDQRRLVFIAVLVGHDPGEPGALAGIVGGAAGIGSKIKSKRQALHERRIAGHQTPLFERFDLADPGNGPAQNDFSADSAAFHGKSVLHF